MRFYIATTLENYAEHGRVREELIEMGHQITYDWTVHGAVYGEGLHRIQQVARLESAGVQDADFVVVLWPGGRGTHVELGIAIARGKPIFLVSDVKEHHEATKETCAFYHHFLVQMFRSSSEMLDYIRKNS